MPLWVHFQRKRLDANRDVFFFGDAFAGVVIGKILDVLRAFILRVPGSFTGRRSPTTRRAAPVDPLAPAEPAVLGACGAFFVSCRGSLREKSMSSNRKYWKICPAIGGLSEGLVRIRTLSPVVVCFAASSVRRKFFGFGMTEWMRPSEKFRSRFVFPKDKPVVIKSHGAK